MSFLFAVTREEEAVAWPRFLGVMWTVLGHPGLLSLPFPSLCWLTLVVVLKPDFHVVTPFLDALFKSPVEWSGSASKCRWDSKSIAGKLSWLFYMVCNWYYKNWDSFWQKSVLTLRGGRESEVSDCVSSLMVLEEQCHWEKQDALS